MGTGRGYCSKAAFRIMGYPAANLYPTALGTPTPSTLGAYDLLPFNSETVKEALGFLNDETLSGGAGFDAMDIIESMPGGSMPFPARYLGLNQILSAALGFEKIRTTAALESPAVFGTSYSDVVAAGSSTSVVNYTNAIPGLTNTNAIGWWFRNETISGVQTNNRCSVRAITAVDTTAKTITVSPALGVAPAATNPFTIAKAFSHTYELARDLHVQSAIEVITDAFKSAHYFSRLGVLGIDKSVSVWEWQGVMINKLMFKFSRTGLEVSVEWLPFRCDRRTSDRNASSTGWTITPLAGAITRRIMFADCAFRIGAQATGAYTTLALLGISDLELTLDNNLDGKTQTLDSGIYRAEPVRAGKRKVTGSFTVPRHTTDSRLNSFVAGDILMAALTCTGPDLFSGSSYPALLNIMMRGLKYTAVDLSVPGAQVIPGKYDFQCIAPAINAMAFTPTSGLDQSELIIQTQDNYPFNDLMGQGVSAY